MLVIVVVVKEESVIIHVEIIFGGDRGDHGGNCEGDENPSDDNDIFIRDVGREDGGMYQCIAGEKEIKVFMVIDDHVVHLTNGA